MKIEPKTEPPDDIADLIHQIPDEIMQSNLKSEPYSADMHVKTEQVEADDRKKTEPKELKEELVESKSFEFSEKFNRNTDRDEKPTAKRPLFTGIWKLDKP